MGGDGGSEDGEKRADEDKRVMTFFKREIKPSRGHRWISDL